MKEFSQVCVFIVLCCIVNIHTNPVEQQNVFYEEIRYPGKTVAVLQVDTVPDPDQKSSNRVPRQDNSDEDGEEVDPNNVPLTPDQLSGIGNNVVKVVTSALTGNVGGVVNGGLTLLNTRNRVNSLLATFGVTDKPAQPLNGTLSANATTLATTTPSDDEDDDEDYPLAETSVLKKSKTFYWF